MDADRPAWSHALLDAVRSLRFGSVEVVVHARGFGGGDPLRSPQGPRAWIHSRRVPPDARVVQIERREKVRLGADPRRPEIPQANPTPSLDRPTGSPEVSRPRKEPL